MRSAYHEWRQRHPGWSQGAFGVTLNREIPRSEYPRPQFVRPDWLCLNGEWAFEIDQADSGYERGMLNQPLSGKITVPFCPESELSGVYNRDFLNAVWYRREVAIPQAW